MTIRIPTLASLVTGLQTVPRAGGWLGAAVLLASCNSVLGLNQFRLESEPAADSLSVAECATQLDCKQDEDRPAICRQPAGRCVELKSEDCKTISGDYRNDGAIVIGSLFAFGGSQTGASQARENSARMAIAALNAQGGIPRGPSTANSRPLVMVSCDASVDLLRAGRHLVEEIGVPAIVGPNGSQDTLDLSRELSVEAGTLVLTPTALAASIADLLDRDLTWQMVPTDAQRAPLVVHELQAMASELQQARGSGPVKLTLLFRNDALGIGTRTGLSSLELNGAPLADPRNLGTNVHIDAYDLDRPDQRATVMAEAEFAPDIIVLVGTAELLPNFMLPLERAWPAAKPRPLYMLTDALKLADLIQAVADNDDLRRRIRGTGLTPSPRSKPVFDEFWVNYQLAYPSSPESIGIGPSYDATFAIAFALAATYDQPPSGRSVATGLRQLSGGDTVIEVRETNVLAAYARLAMHEPISAIGTFGPLAWGDNGAVLGGTLELWCIGKEAGRMLFRSSGLTMDVASGALHGEYTQCL